MKTVTKPNSRKNHGFTLVEIVIYVSILTVIMVASVTYIFSLNGLLTQYRVESEIYNAGTAAVEQIVLSLRQADEFDIGSSVTQPSDNGVLSVTGASTTVFSRVGNQLQLEIDGINYGSITPDNVFVTGFTVYRYPTTVGDFVRVELDLNSTIGSISSTDTFYGGSVLRGSL